MALFIFLISLKMRILQSNGKIIRRATNYHVLFLGLMPKEKEFHKAKRLIFQHIEFKKILKKLIAQKCGGIGRHKDLKSLEGNFVPVQVRLWHHLI